MCTVWEIGHEQVITDHKDRIGSTLGIGAIWTLQGHAAIAATYIKPFGVLFINLIKMVIVPLVFSSLIVGVTSLGDPKLLGKIDAKTLAYYLIWRQLP